MYTVPFSLGLGLGLAESRRCSSGAFLLGVGGGFAVALGFRRCFFVGGPPAGVSVCFPLNAGFVFDGAPGSAPFGKFGFCAPGEIWCAVLDCFP